MSQPSFSAPALRRVLFGCAALVILTASCRGVVQPETPKAPPAPRPQPVEPPDRTPKAAPELDGGTDWLNTAGPIKLKDLRGKIVVLDFWTLCCINCIHTFPDLAKLEKKYPNEVVVIGIHSPKFDSEKSTESIRKAILRYELTHPVVNDAEQAIWNAYDCESWPSLFVIDAQGRLIAGGSGEGLYEALEDCVAKLVKDAREKKVLNERPLRFELARQHETGASPLFFPGKVLADAASNRLFIADSTHHRIVITDLQGKKIAVAGTGQSALADGPFDSAKFNDPQGMALRGDILYVADRKNHVLRALDLKTQQVTTIAGTGEQGHDRLTPSGPARKTPMNSPWDLVFVGDKLFIVQAGYHQVWTLDLKAEKLELYAGRGPERIIDDELLDACFAQPSGVTTDGRMLYVADCEASAVRALRTDGTGEVKTVVGVPNRNLFQFGDKDGVGDKVRLQHAIGIVHHDGKLFVADTYNGKIKIVDPKSRTATTFLGGEDTGWLAAPLFHEPAGLSVAGDKLYVADTNAHRIRVVDLRTKAVSTLNLQGVEAPKTMKP